MFFLILISFILLCTKFISETVRISDIDDLEERAKLELSTNRKRLELMSISLNEAKQEISELRAKNLDMEKQLIENRILSTASFWLDKPQGVVSYANQDNQNNPNKKKKVQGSKGSTNTNTTYEDGQGQGQPFDEYSSGETDGEEEYMHEGLEELRNVVKERSTLSLLPITV